MHSDHPVALETITKLQRASILSHMIHDRQLVLSQWIDDRHCEREITALECEIRALIADMQAITEDWK